jgi:hypothetical protein
VSVAICDGVGLRYEVVGDGGLVSKSIRRCRVVFVTFGGCRLIFIDLSCRLLRDTKRCLGDALTCRL